MVDPEVLRETLAVVAEVAPMLRRTGVTRLRVGELEVYIDPPPPDGSTTRRAPEQEDDFLDPNKYKRADRMGEE